MLVLRWIGGLLAIPLRIAAQAMTLLGLPNHKLWEIIWWVSCDEMAAVASLQPDLMSGRTDEVLAKVQRWNERQPGPILICMAGSLQAEAAIAPLRARHCWRGERWPCAILLLCWTCWSL